jgi:integrase
MRGPHIEKRRWTYRGEPRESDWYYLVFYVRTPLGAKRVYRRTSPPTDQKRLALEQLHRAIANPTGPGLLRTTAAVLEAYRRYLVTNSPAMAKARRYYFAWLTQLVGGVAPDLFRQRHVDLLIDAMTAKRLAEGSKASLLRMLRTAFRHAEREGHVPAGAAGARFYIPFGFPERHVVWTFESVRAVADEMPAWAARHLYLLLFTGLRRGDALGLRWDQVGGNRLVFRQKKTRSETILPLNSRAVELLESFPSPRGVYVFENPETGRPYSGRSFNYHFYAARTTVGGAATLHDLRRTFATWALNSGASVPMIAALLGQRGTRLVGRYAHADLAPMREATERALAAVHVAVADGEPRTATESEGGEKEPSGG